METEKIRYFTVVAKTENIRRASEILHITPSALSKSIRILEAELSMQLIMPQGRGITITPQGRAFATKAELILEKFNNLKDEIQDDLQKNKTKPLRIATFEVFSTYFLNSLENISWKDRGLELQDCLPGEIERAVEQELVDLGITYLPIPYQNIEHLKIISIEMGVFKKKGTFINQPQQELIYVVPAHPILGLPSRIKGLDGWPVDAYERKIQFEVTLMESALELCRQGRCVGYFPCFIIEEHNRKYKTEFQLERHASPYVNRKCFSDVYLVKRKDQEEDHNFKLIGKMIRKACKIT